MRFKIQGEKEEVDDKVTTVVEILGKQAITRLIDERVNKTINQLEVDLGNLRERVYSLEEEIKLKNRKEIIKFTEKEEPKDE